MCEAHWAQGFLLAFQNDIEDDSSALATTDGLEKSMEIGAGHSGNPDMRAKRCKKPQEDFSERSHRPVSILVPSLTSSLHWANQSIFSSRKSGLLYPSREAVVRNKGENSVNVYNRGTRIQWIWPKNSLQPLWKLHPLLDWETLSRWS